MHRVRGEEQLALVAEILLDALIAEALEVESKFRSCDECAAPRSDQLQLGVFSGHLLPWMRMWLSCFYGCP